MNLSPLPLFRLVLLVVLTSSAQAGDYPFSVERIKLTGGEGVLAVNDGPLSVAATIDITHKINAGSDHIWPMNIELKPYTSKTLGVVYPANPEEPFAFDLQVSKTIGPGKLDASRRTETKSPHIQDSREDARFELQKLLEPVKRLPRWFDTVKIASPFISEGLPFLLVAYLLLLTVLFDLRSFTALIQRRWLTAVGQGCLAGATGFLLWLQYAAVPSLYLPRFMKYVMREPTSVIPCVIGLLFYWLTAKWLVPPRESYHYSRI